MIRKRDGIVATQRSFFQILTVGHFCHFYFDLGHRNFWNYPRTILDSKVFILTLGPYVGHILS